MDIASITKIAIDTAKAVCSTDEFKSFMFGEYDDGTPRSLPDAIREE